MNIVLLLLNCFMALFLAVSITRVFHWVKTDYQNGKDWISTGGIGSLLLWMIGLIIGGILIILLNIVPQSMHKTIQTILVVIVGPLFYGGSAGSIVFIFLVFCRYVSREMRQRFNDIKTIKQESETSWTQRMKQMLTVILR